MTEEEIRLIITGRNDLGRPLNAASRGVATFADGTVGHFRRVARHVLNLQNVVIGAGAAMAAKSLFAPSIETETFRTQYENLLGTAQEARDRVEALMNFSDVTPFEPEPVVQAALVLDRFTRGAEDTVDMVRLVGDAAAATGSGFGDLGGWIGRAYAMIKGGEPIGEATRRLLELGVITPDVKAKIAALQEQNRSAAEVWAVLRGALEQHEGAMEKLSRTTSGRLSTLAGKWSALRRDVADSAVPELNGAIDELIGTIDELRESGNLQAAGERMGEAIRTLHDTARSLVQFIDENRETLATIGMTYAGFRIIRSLTAAVAMTSAGMKALAASTAVSAAATEAHAAASTKAAAAAALFAGTMTMVKTALLGLVGLGIQAGIAFIAVELYSMRRAAKEAEDALDELGRTGDRVSGDYETYARRFGTFRQMLQNLKDAYLGESEGEKLYLGPASVQGGYEDKYKDVLDRLERLRRAAVTAAKSGGGDEVELWKRVTGLDSLEQLDLSSLDSKESALRRLLARYESLSGEKDAALGLQIAVRTARKRMRPEGDGGMTDPDDTADESQQHAELAELKAKIRAKNRELAEAMERAAAERAYRAAQAEKRAARTTAEAHLEALDGYLRQADAARAAAERAQDRRSEEAAQASIARAEREAEAEARAAGLKIAAMRESAAKLDAEAREARQRADRALWALLNPEEAQAQRAAAAAEAERVAVLRRKAERLAERFTQRDDEGRWMDRYGRTASRGSQEILDWAWEENRANRKGDAAADADRAVREARERLADSQDALRGAMVLTASRVLELKEEIAGLRGQLPARQPGGQPGGGSAAPEAPSAPSRPMPSAPAAPAGRGEDPIVTELREQRRVLEDIRAKAGLPI